MVFFCFATFQQVIADDDTHKQSTLKSLTLQKSSISAVKEKKFKAPLLYMANRNLSQTSKAEDQRQGPTREIPCKESVLFNELFKHRLEKFKHCAPEPIRVSSENLGKSSQVWHIQSPPKVFYWEQEVPQNLELVAELQDTEGMPWPFKSETKHLEGKTIIELKPMKQIPKKRTFYLAGQLRGKDGKKVEAWIQKLVVG